MLGILGNGRINEWNYFRMDSEGSIEYFLITTTRSRTGNTSFIWHWRWSLILILFGNSNTLYITVSNKLFIIQLKCNTNTIANITSILCQLASSMAWLKGFSFVLVSRKFLCYNTVLLHVRMYVYVWQLWSWFDGFLYR